MQEKNFDPAQWLRRYKTLQKSTQITILLAVIAGTILILGIFKEPSTNETDSLARLSVDVIIKLGIVLLLIYLSAFLFQKFGAGVIKRRTRQMQIRETLPLSPHRALYLVQLGDRSLLIGATDQSVTLIAEIEDIDQVEEIQTKPLPVNELDVSHQA